MSEDLPPFARNLAAALAARSPEQEARLVASAREAGIQGGFHAAVAHLAGLSGPSVLSDILSGRTSGVRFQASLAQVLGVDPRWMRGEAEGVAPEWALDPLAAYRRWQGTLQGLWKARLLHTPVGHLPEDDSRRQRPTARERAAVMGHLLGSSAPPSTVASLAAGTWHLVPFTDLLHLAARLGQADPTHPGHLQTGHALSAAVAQALEDERRDLRRAQARFALPPHLFQLVRMALCGLRAQREFQGKGRQAVDDALEVLWRHQAEARGLDQADLLPAFTEETGRTAWTPLREIQRRHEDPGLHPADRYVSARSPR